MFRLRTRIAASIFGIYVVLCVLGLLLSMATDGTSQHLIKELLLLPLIVPAMATGILSTSSAIHATVSSFWLYVPVSALVVGLFGYLCGRLFDR
jgi:hypothetical protein